jgi:hypothetical protein
MGVGASYFFANHKIIENKNAFKSEVELLSAKYNAKVISFNELQKQNQELNGKIFQLLFTYFGIDLRSIELNTINKAKNSTASNEIRTVEKIVYVEKNALEEKVEKEEIRNKKGWNKNILDINLTEFLEDALPVRSKSKEFEQLKRNYNYLQAVKKNKKRYTLKFDLSYSTKNKNYLGTYKVKYSLLKKNEREVTLSGQPTIFITNHKFPGLIGIWIQSNRLALISTFNEFKSIGPRGLVFKRDKFSVFSVETTLFKKKFF